MAVNETLDESIDMTQDYDEEERVGVVNDAGMEYEDASENPDKWFLIHKFTYMIKH